MNEFEKEMLSMLNELKSDMNNMKKDVSELKSDMNNMKADISEIKDDISNIKEDLEITRVAANYNGEKLEEIADELKKMHVIS